MAINLYTTVIGSTPILFTTDEVFFATPVLSNAISLAYETDFVFFVMDGQDLWARVNTTGDEPRLELLSNDEVVLSTEMTSKEEAASFTPDEALLIITAPFAVDKQDLQSQVAAPYALEDIYSWMRKKESEKGLEEEEVNGLLVGIWSEKPPQPE